MNNTEFVSDYERGMDSLYVIAPFLFRLARSLGVPVADDGVKTACVAFEEESKTISFHINPEYASSLSSEQIGFTIAHETYHVLLSHLAEVMSETFESNEILTIAHECIVNDSLEQSFAGLVPPDGVYHGSQFGADFSNFSTTTAYEFLKNVLPESSSSSDGGDQDGSENGESGSGSGDASGDPIEGGTIPCGGIVVPDGTTADDIQSAVGNAIKDALKATEDDGDTVPSEIEDAILEAGINPSDESTKIFSRFGASGEMFVSPDASMNLNWKALLAKINPKVMTTRRIRTVQSWKTPRRKMVASYPKVILPVYRTDGDPRGNGGDRPTVLLALDVSGSIPDSMIRGLASLASSMPEDLFDGRAITWSSSIREFDPDDRKIAMRSGTDIDLVWDYAKKIEKENGKPPYVVVITDGYCSFYNYEPRQNPDHLRKFWFWGGIDKSSSDYIRRNFAKFVNDDSVFDMRDFFE